MEEKANWFRKRRGYQRKAVELKGTVPLLEYPEGSKFSVKSIAYLHVYCKKAPHDIVAQFPKVLTLADVHLALAHYYLNRDEIDAEIEKERAFNTRDTLGNASMSLPSVSLASLVETLKE